MHIRPARLQARALWAIAADIVTVEGIHGR